MRRGSFEEQEGAGDQRVYRLRWDATQYVLTPKEILSGLFVRYLISQGKLSEFDSAPELSAGRVQCENAD